MFQPLLVKFNLAASWRALGFQYETALALLGTVDRDRRGGGRPLHHGLGRAQGAAGLRVVVPLIIAGVAQVAFGLSHWLYFSAAMVFIVEAMTPIMNAHSQTIWQTQTPRELQGRVFAVRRLIAQFTWPLSAALAGWAAGRFDPGMVVAVLGAVLVVFCVGAVVQPVSAECGKQRDVGRHGRRAAGEA